MTVYYLSSVDGDDGSDGLSWANAFETFKYAVETASAAASGPHIVYVDSAHSEDLSGDTTITAAADIRVVCVNRSGGDAPTTGAVVGAQSTNYSIVLAGAFEVFVYGVTFQTGTNTSAAKLVITPQTDGAHWEFESCTFNIYASNSSSAGLSIGTATSVANTYTKFKDCTIRFSNVLQHISPRGGVIEFENLTVSSAGTAPTSLIDDLGNTALNGAPIRFIGCDLSHLGTGKNLVADVASNGRLIVEFVNCKLGSGVNFMVAPTSVLNKGGTTVTAINCSSGDTHYEFYHGDAFGETTAVVTYYADDGAQYDGTNRCSWKIVTRANNCSFYTPYVSPWIDVYHSGTSSITPYLEGLRVDSTTVIQDDEVWGEFSFQATSGSVLATFKNDRMALLGTAADQTSSLTYANWTGSPTDTDSGDSVFKLAAPSATTPAEIGHIRARVCVGEPGLTVYVDPQIRGLS